MDGARRVRCLLCPFEVEAPSERAVRHRREWSERPEDARRKRGRPLGSESADSLTRRVRALARNEPWLTRVEIMRRVGCSQSLVYEALGRRTQAV